MEMWKELPTYHDIVAASARIAGHVRRTPVLESPALNARAGCRVLVKPECLQVTGAFKARGAFNKLVQLSKSDAASGVVAFSSGNHAQAVAWAAGRLGISAKIVMPADAPAIKIDRTRDFGAEVLLYDRHGEDRAAVAQKVADEENRVMVPPYDDPAVIAGQGTAGLEVFEDLARDETLDILIAPAGGGGLAAGCALAAAKLAPGADVYTAEPAGFDDIAQSLEAGALVEIDPTSRSICDSLLTPLPGEITFSVLHAEAAGGLVVTDAEAEAAMRAAFTDLKLVLEPGGAVALAAVLTGRIETRGKTVAVIASGGNVDPALFAEILGRA